MTLPNDSTTQVEQAVSNVRISISDETLADMVEITLRLEGVPVEDEPSENPGLLIADPVSYSGTGNENSPTVSQNRTLLLVADEVDIPEGIEYLVVPGRGDDFDLDPELLIGKVKDMLSGRRPSAEINPVTGLPSAGAFESELRDRISTGERFGVVFADLYHFKSYNRAYSYSKGDRMLVAVGELMKSVLDKNPHPQNFIAHLGSDDFAIITSEKFAQAIAEEIVDLFDEMVAGFYDVNDLTRGTVLVTDRRGHETECPIVTIALAVLLSSRRALSHAAEAFDIAEDLLAMLKSRDVTESCCVVERKTAK